MLGGILVAIVPGLFNGVLVARVKVPSFIATLGMGILVEGVRAADQRRLSGRQTAALPGPAGQWLRSPILAGTWVLLLQVPAEATVADLPKIIPILPNIVLVTIIVTFICWFILAKTQFGQHLYAIGGNFEAAVRAGIPRHAP